MLQIVLFVLAALAAAVSGAETIGGNPGPQYNYVCPNSDNKPALDCYFDAVGHLYTMCKHVKSIEIIEYGYPNLAEGTNSAKSESCVVKQKQNMAKPYQAALKEAARSPQAAKELRELNELWLKALTDLAWKPGESDDDYKARTMTPYAAFSERIVGIETSIQLAAQKPEQKTPSKPAAKPAGTAKPATAAKTASTANTAKAAH